METRLSIDIDDVVQSGDVEELKEALRSLSSFEIADLMVQKNEEMQLRIFSALSLQHAADTFNFLPVKTQQSLLQALPSIQAASLLNSLTPDNRTAFLQDLPRETIDELVKLLSHDERMLTLTLLGYPEGSIGRLMTPDYLAVPVDWSVNKVFEYIKEYGHDSETIDVIYVIDDEGRLIGNVKIRQLLFVPPTCTIKDIMDKHFIALSVNDRDETAINLFRKHNRLALPVIDEEGFLLGIVTIDDILRLANEEATEDIQKIGGMEVLDEPYMQAPFFELMKKRAGWLVVLFLGEMLTATALGFFEHEIAKAVVLTLFLPLIISSGGNAGSQATTLIIRSMTLGEIKLKDWWKIVKREVFSGIFLGSVLGFIGFLRVVVWGSFFNSYGEHWLGIAFTVCFALLGIVLCGTLSGAVFPLILRRLGLDPATASAPFVATVVDLLGVVIYFLIAIAILKGSLL